jgi:hypothetical protein
MSEEKKDLTNLLQYSQSLRDSGQAPPPPEGSVMEETPIEAIDDFESLEDYAQSNPAPEPQPDLPFDPEPEPQLDSLEESFPPEQPSTQDSALPAFDEITPPSEQYAAENQEFPAFEETAPPTDPFAGDLPDFQDSPIEETPPEILLSPKPLEEVKKFADNAPIGKPVVPAALPFSLLIEGQLTREEKDKLLELITRENMGIREIDLEPQLALGKILIPRISEFAGVLIVQALRSTRAKMKLGPSDSIFCTSDTRSDADALPTPSNVTTATLESDLEHPAESIPISTSSKLPQINKHRVIDTLTATATLRSQVVEAESSSIYQEILEGLQRELKYKAYRKNATGIILFKIQLTPLSSPTHYHILVTGTAIRPAETEPTG